MIEAERFEAWLRARSRTHGWGWKTRAVRAFAAEYGVGESTVWRWLGGAVLPAWLVREIARATSGTTTARRRPPARPGQG